VHDTLVLCYHALSRTWPAALSVTPAAFAEQLALLAARGYRGVTFSQAALEPEAGRRVAVTFDDAFRSVAEHARPALDRLGWPATVFGVTTHVRTGARLSWEGTSHWEDTEHAAELEGLGWDGLEELAGAGWEVGSHTATHPHLTRLSDAELERELAGSREAMTEALGRCDVIAYPYGDVDRRVVEATRRAGYRAAAALPARWHRPRPLEYPRPGVYHPDDLRRFRLKVSPVVRRARLALGR
jgi:peptidoglycan/xylan/chitin deacetylase (PgdA/CDA1 family)